MKKQLTKTLFAILFLCSTHVQAAFVIKNETPATTENKTEIVEVATHKTFKEKIIEKIATTNSKKLAKNFGIDPTQIANTNSINIMTLTGFICSIVGLAVPFLCVLGLIFSLIGLNQIKKKNESGEKYAIAGIIMSTIEIALQLLIIGFMLVIF